MSSLGQPWFSMRKLFSRRSCRSSSVIFFVFWAGKFCGKVDGIFSDAQNKGSTISGEISEKFSFREKVCDSKKIFHANFVLQTCHPNKLCPKNLVVLENQRVVNQQVLDPTPLNPTPATCHKRKQKLRCNFRKVAAAEVALQHSLFCSADVIFTKSCAATNERKTTLQH